MIFDFDELRYGESPEDVILSPSAPDGDFNFDGLVNAADYVTWRKNDPANEAAYGQWRTNFGAGASAAGGARGVVDSATVPEPTCFILVWIGLLFCSAGCRSTFVNRRCTWHRDK
jgi:hypothetical protein